MNKTSSFAVGIVVLAAIVLSTQTAYARQADRAPATRPATTAPMVTPRSIPGSEPFVYRDLQPEPVRLHVFKPDGWRAGDRRPAMIFFFGGGFTHGTPEASGASWARWAAKHDMVGIAPDYRTLERFGTPARECLADGRLSLRWVQDHADELGIDRDRIVVGGSSAGGTVALWTAIEHAPPDISPDESPKAKPRALVLFSAPSDLVADVRAKRFGPHPDLYSPLHQLDAKMPPILLFHGDADTTVPMSESVSLHQKLIDTNNVCQFITVPGGKHNFINELPEWKGKSQSLLEQFLKQQRVLPN